jgi:hypothetical protein
MRWVAETIKFCLSLMEDQMQFAAILDISTQPEQIDAPPETIQAAR